MSVRDWMTPDPLIVGPQTELRDALARMVLHRVKHLPLVDNDRLLGILSGPQLLSRLAGGGEEPLDMERDARRPALEFCQPVPVISPDDDLEVAFRSLRSATCLPVVENGRLVGLLSEGNLIRYLLGEVAPSRARRRAPASDSRFEILLNLVRDVTHAQDIKEILEVVARHVRTVMPVDQAFLLLKESDRAELSVAASVRLAGPMLDDLSLMPIQDTLSGWVATHRKSLHIDDLRLEKRFPESRERLHESAEIATELRSVVAAPLMERGTCLGVVHFWSRKPCAFVDSDLELLELIAGNIAFLVDRSWRLKREYALVDELREANRIKDEFLAVVTHDLNNALQSILSYSQLMLRRASDEKTERIARGLTDSARYMRSLTGDLHDLARLGMQAIKLNLSTVDLGSLVETTLETQAEFAAREQVTLRAADTSGDLIVEADPVRLRQVIENLVTNAIKYNRPQGWVEVRVRGEIDGVTLEIQDSGIGIAADDQARVFDLFQRAKNNRRVDSSGLGLSITRQLVELHGGDIRLESRPDVGSTFRVRLPRRSGPGATEAVARPAAN